MKLTNPLKNTNYQIQEGMGSVNNTISIKEFGSVIKNLPTKKAPGTGGVYY